MKAFLLAAGVGSRLRPITDTVPKCMVPVGGRPLLDIWLDQFRAAGVDEVLVNLHHLPDVVRSHLAGWSGPPAVRLAYEPELLGSAGTLMAHRDWVTGEEFFLACNADNLTDFPLSELISAQRSFGAEWVGGAERSGGADATLAVFRSDNPSAGGVVEVDGDGLVVGFAEKPSAPVSDLVNAGIYALRSAVLDELDGAGLGGAGLGGAGRAGAGALDIGYHLLPRLVGRARAIPISGYFRDIGTVEAYRLAQEEWGSSHDHHADAAAHRAAGRRH